MNARLAIRIGMGLVLLVAMAAAVPAGVRVKLEDVPKPAVKAIQDRFTKATIRYVDRETNGTYEFAMKEGDRLFDAGVTADGKLLNIKEEVAEANLPKAVKDGIQKRFPGGKIVETEKVIVIDGKRETVTYELKLKDGKTTLEAVFDEGGKYVGEPK
jgi:hypothetical protein